MLFQIITCNVIQLLMSQDLQPHDTLCVRAYVCVSVSLCAHTNSSGGRSVSMEPKTSDPREEKEGMKMIYVFH